jgi:hypothetical protein
MGLSSWLWAMMNLQIQSNSHRYPAAPWNAGEQMFPAEDGGGGMRGRGT